MKHDLGTRLDRKAPVVWRPAPRTARATGVLLALVALVAPGGAQAEVSGTCSLQGGMKTPAAVAPRLSFSVVGKRFHGVYPGGVTGEEDDLTPTDVDRYEQAAGKQVAWIYFSHNWYRDRNFPRSTADWIQARGSTPYIRLMMRSSAREDRADRPYRLKHILEGRFDEDLLRWGAQAKAFAGPVWAEWGTECNGKWFPWNGRYHGAGSKRGFGDPEKPDGPERFVAVFRHIVRKVREGGGLNVQWIFHVNNVDVPDSEWNAFEKYYPGDDWISALAVSVYGPKTPYDDVSETRSFGEQMDEVYPRLIALAPGRPILVAEFGCAVGHPKIEAHVWAEAALTGLLGNRWPNVSGFSWWNERWPNGGRRPDTTMRLQDDPRLANAFKIQLTAAGEAVVTRPVNETSDVPLKQPIPPAK